MELAEAADEMAKGADEFLDFLEEVDVNEVGVGYAPSVGGHVVDLALAELGEASLEAMGVMADRFGEGEVVLLEHLYGVVEKGVDFGAEDEVRF